MTEFAAKGFPGRSKSAGDGRAAI